MLLVLIALIDNESQCKESHPLGIGVYLSACTYKRIFLMWPCELTADPLQTCVLRAVISTNICSVKGHKHSSLHVVNKGELQNVE